ncbi:MAG: translation initiation factor eIF-2B [Ignavibacteriales bacterium]|nr:translation initiation factor eIF-2B [Ignavibacteriales bacterium]
MTLPREILQRIKEIESDTTSGSLAITRKAAITVLHFVVRMQHSRPSDVRSNLIRISERLIHAQPAMGALVNLAGIMRTVSEESEEKKLSQIVKAVVKEYVRQLGESSEAISLSASRLIKNNRTVITHSFSSVVLQTLLRAHNQGRRFRVICTESRPTREGLTLAKKLGKHGIPTTVVADAAVFSHLSNAASVLVGADAVTRNALVNKVGTYPIALAAKVKRIPFFVLCCSLKFVPDRLIPSTFALQNPEEILGPRRFRHVTARNIYFDSTPLAYITRIINEKGAFTPGKFTREAKLSMRPNRFRPLP